MQYELVKSVTADIAKASCHACKEKIGDGPCYRAKLYHAKAGLLSSEIVYYHIECLPGK